MPELPEVETVVRGLRLNGLEGGVIESVDVRWAATVKPAAAQFTAALRGRRIEALGRRAKYIVMGLEGGETLLIHLRMTGKLLLTTPRIAGEERFDRVIFKLADGRLLRFNDMRKFGRMQLTAHPEAVLAPLGPEPLEGSFTVARLRQCLTGCRRQLKAALLDQHIVAGLGNIYVDEALWEARLHPARCAGELSAEEIARLRLAIRKVLRRGISADGTTLGDGAGNFYSVAGRRGRHADGLMVFRRHGEPCPRCGATIQRITLAQRGTHFCERCQQRPQ